MAAAASLALPCAPGVQARLGFRGGRNTTMQSMRVRASAAASTAEEATSSEGAPALVRQSPLLSSQAIKQVLAGELPVAVDHYARLGLPRGASEEQIRVTYRKLARELMVEEGEDEEKARALGVLRESFELLTSEEERRLYDWSLERVENREERYVWPHEADVTQSRDYAPATYTPEKDEEGTRITGFIYLGWFALSVFLSIFFKNPN